MLPDYEIVQYGQHSNSTLFQPHLYVDANFLLQLAVSRSEWSLYHLLPIGGTIQLHTIVKTSVWK